MFVPSGAAAPNSHSASITTDQFEHNNTNGSLRSSRSAESLTLATQCVLVMLRAERNIVWGLVRGQS